MKRKIKKKIWIISIILLVIYIITLVINPSVWISLLPIIIPTGILTVGIPSYAIIRNTKEEIEQIVEIHTKQIQECNTNQNTKAIEKTATNNNQINAILKPQYEQEQNQEEKPKIKTKGTIH